jgi:HNH endonuclease
VTFQAAGKGAARHVPNDKICIYCSQTDPSRFRGVEHVIPQGFGRFGSGTPTLDCVCDDCNAYFGRELDQLLTRETYEGISRYSRGQFSSQARPQKRVALTLADPAEAGDFQGLRISLDGTTGQLMPPVAQFHIHNFKTGKDEVYFLPQISGLALPETDCGKPGANGERGTWRCKILAPSRDAHDAVVEALQKAGIDFRPGTPFEIPWAEETATPPSFLVEITSEIDKPHKRAIAKILMNFIAFHLGRDEVLQPRWDFLRRYVRNGEGEIKARLSLRPFWTGQEMEELRFRDDSINVRIENTDGHIVGALQFYNLYIYEMILAENTSLGPGQEIGRRFTPSELPVEGEKRPI